MFTYYLVRPRSRLRLVILGGDANLVSQPADSIREHFAPTSSQALGDFICFADCLDQYSLLAFQQTLRHRTSVGLSGLSLPPI